MGTTTTLVVHSVILEMNAKEIRMSKRIMMHNSYLNILLEKKMQNPSLYYDYDVDDKKRLKHVFWADGLARKSWHHFGDVLVFDTTYGTNQYSIIFAPFTGVNHHWKTVDFGAGFIKDETISSFIWLFNAWQRAMSQCIPALIITDQDPAMAAAISSVFPTAHH